MLFLRFPYQLPSTHPIIYKNLLSLHWKTVVLRWFFVVVVDDDVDDDCLLLEKMIEWYCVVIETRNTVEFDFDFDFEFGFEIEIGFAH